MQFDMTGFNEGMAALLQDAKLICKQIIKTETAALIKELVRSSPPRDRRKSLMKIEKTIRKRFIVVKKVDMKLQRKLGLAWMFSTPDFLFGVDEGLYDLRKASVPELFERLHRDRKRGVWRLPFRKPRANQNVHLVQDVMVKRSQVRAMLKFAETRFGRLKASWLKSVADGVISQVSGIPGWVANNIRKSRGSYLNGLNTDDPSFTVISTAYGVGQHGMYAMIQRAIDFRAKSMVSNAKWFASGKKHLADYGRARTATVKPLEMAA